MYCCLPMTERVMWRDYAAERLRALARYDLGAEPKQSKGSSGIDYIRLAELIIAPDKEPEDLTRAEQDRAVAMAVGLLKDRGAWPASDPRRTEAQRRRRKAA